VTPRRKGVGTTIAVVAVVIVLAIATIAFVTLTSQTRTPIPGTSSAASSETSSMSSGGSSTTYSTTSASDLRLQITLNSSTIQSLGEVAVHIEALNLKSQNVSLIVVPNQNISRWNGYDFFCGSNPSDSLVGFALLKGHISAGNVSSAGPPLQLAASSVELPCPYSLPLNDTTFLPNSDKTVSFSYCGQTGEPPFAVTAEVNATTGYCTFSSSLSGGCQETSGVLGYWNATSGRVGNSTLASPAFTYLPPGEYTVEAMDDWGQTAYAHFQAESPPINSTRVPTMTVNGSLYYADDVSSDITLGGPGYSYFHNASVTFLGVTFETYCPPSDSGCPVPSGTTITSTTTVMLGLIRFSATFPDGTTETMNAVIGDATYVYVFSRHTDPQAGILISITYGKTTTAEVYLLVS